jgi:hypothetical protein
MLKQGAVGFLGATKVAYGIHAWDDPYDGSSQSFDYFFTTCVTSGDYTQGEAQQWSLIEMYQHNLWYYLKYETFEWGALWGNPDLGMIYIPEENLPPNPPHSPFPWDGSIDVDPDADLSWSCTDPNYDPLTFDVYFGTSSNPPLVSSGQSEKSYDPGTMEEGQKYYWKIVAEDDEGASTIGPTWDFTVWINSAPVTPYNPNPPDEATDVDINIVLSWSCDDPDGDSLTYDVYFEAEDGTPDEMVSNNQTDTFWTPPYPLEFYTKHYWRIVAWDSRGAMKYGVIWEFETGGEPNTPPDPPFDPDPADGETVTNIQTDISWSCYDPDGDAMMFDVYFGKDSNPEELVSNDQIQNSYDPGQLESETTYYWRIIVIDEHGATNTGPIWHFSTSEEVNYPPKTPKISGPTEINANEEVTYSVYASDPDGDQVYFMLDWGDGTINWDGPYDSGEVVEYKHTFTEPGEYKITVKAKDVYDAESGWAELDIMVPRYKMKFNYLFNNYLARLANMYPMIRLILQHLGL